MSSLLRKKQKNPPGFYCRKFDRISSFLRTKQKNPPGFFLKKCGNTAYGTKFLLNQFVFYSSRHSFEGLHFFKSEKHEILNGRRVKVLTVLYSTVHCTVYICMYVSKLVNNEGPVPDISVDNFKKQSPGFNHKKSFLP